MNDPERQLDELFSATRAARPDVSAVETAFETRLLSRIRMCREQESRQAVFIWKWTVVFAVVTLILGAWSLADSPNGARDFDEMASVNAEESLLVTYLTGK